MCPASNNADSYIYFRLRCDMSISGKSQTEFYSIKAFGKVADFLRDNIQMNTELYIEALARSFRYTKTWYWPNEDWVSCFHGSNHSDWSINRYPCKWNCKATIYINRHRYPSSSAKLKDDMKWQKMSDEEVRTASEKWRTVYAEQKQLHTEKSLYHQTTIKIQ